MSAGLFGPDEDQDESATVDPLERAASDAPLADRMRPESLEEFVGQAHLMGPQGLLAKMLAGDSLQSLILWGPPGSGKTTMARLVAAKSEVSFVPYSAVLSGIKEIREVMKRAALERKRTGKRTLLFIDEIHRFNKAQQDAFLPHVERGDILLIGATTENPSFEVRGALLSRVRTLVLEPLEVEDLLGLLSRALADEERGLRAEVEVPDSSMQAIAQAADGDARRALTLLETAAQLVPEGGVVDAETLSTALQSKTLLYDKTGEEHYNLISALHKSVRNSDENAALYWLTRMMAAGEDGNYIARRLIRMASEDVGLADPFALRQTLDAAESFRQLGYPEGQLALVQAAVYLARAPKDNSLYVGLGRAQTDVEETAAQPVPLHLRNASTGLMKSLGYGKGYRYAHDDPDAPQEMTCMPPSLERKRYFKQRNTQRPAPGNRGEEDES